MKLPLLPLILPLSLLSLAGGCSDSTEQPAPDTELRQIPIDIREWGVYAWTLVDDGLTYRGSIIVRGDDADAIEGLDHESGTETWYFDRVDTGGRGRSLSLRLRLQRDTDSVPLQDALAAIVNEQTELGAMDVEPDWQPDPTINGRAHVFTLASCHGPASCEDGIERFSVQFSDPAGDMPVIFGDDPALVSIFSGEESAFTLAEGDQANFSSVSAEDDGYPDETWVSCGG